MGEALLAGLFDRDLAGDKPLTTSSFNAEKNPCFFSILTSTPNQNEKKTIAEVVQVFLRPKQKNVYYLILETETENKRSRSHIREKEKNKISEVKKKSWTNRIKGRFAKEDDGNCDLVRETEGREREQGSINEFGG